MTISLVLIICAFVCALLATFNIPTGKVNMVGATLAFWLAAVLVGSGFFH